MVEIDEADFPRCAQCDLPVESFLMEYTDTGIIFIAFCHNAQERVEIPDELWDDALASETFQITDAFKS